MKRNVSLLYIFMFLMEFRLYGPFIIIYFGEVSGSYTLGMSVLSITFLTSAALEIPTGVLSDRLGRGGTIRLGAVFSVAAVLSYAAAPEFSGWAALVLMAGGAFEGVARSLFSSNNAALLYDSLCDEGEEAQYHHYFGRMGTFAHGALACAALLGGLFALVSLQLVFWLSVIPQILAVAVAMGLREPNHVGAAPVGNLKHLASALRHLAKSPKLLWLTVAQSVSFGFGEANYQFTSAFYRTLWPLWAIGLLRSVANILAAIGFWIAGRVIDRFQHLRVVIACSVIGQVFNLVGIALANVLSPIIMTSPSLAYGLSTTAKNHLFQQSFTSEQRATLGSIVQFTGSVVFALAAVLIGALADTAGDRTAMVTALLIQALVIPIYIRLFRQKT